MTDVSKVTRNISTIKKDRLRYTKNKLSSTLAILGILFDVFYFLSIYQSDVDNYYYTATIGLSVVYNLIFLLAVFLSSEGVKNYKIAYSYVVILVGLLQGVRIFGIPRMAHNAVTTVNGMQVTVMSDKQFMYVSICLLISGAMCIASGIVGLIKAHTLAKYKRENNIQ